MLRLAEGFWKPEVGIPPKAYLPPVGVLVSGFDAVEVPKPQLSRVVPLSIEFVPSHVRVEPARSFWPH